MAKRRVGRYANEFRRMCVERMKQCDDIVALSKGLDIHRRLSYRWRDQMDPVEKGTVKLTARRNIKDKEADSPSLVGHPIVFLKLLRERSSPLSRWQILTSSLLDNLPLNINVALVGSANR